MLQLENKSPFRCAMAGFADARGVEQLLIVVKATFTLQPMLSLAAEQSEVRRADAYAETAAGAPGAKSLHAPAELSLPRPCTDVVLAASAHAPAGRPVTQLDVGVAIAEHEVRLRVFGDRFWRERSASPTPPAPFTTMPLGYERAFGGKALGKEDNTVEERNPAGVGFIGSCRAEELSGARLPNVEDPHHLIAAPADRPAPAGFGAIAPSWLPRRQYAGTYDEKWQSQRAPFLPSDFDARFLQVAHPALIQPGLLKGGEPVRLLHHLPDAELDFTLPEIALTAQAETRAGKEALSFSMSMVRIEPSQNRLELLYQAALPCAAGLLWVHQVSVALRSMRGISE